MLRKIQNSKAQRKNSRENCEKRKVNFEFTHGTGEKDLYQKFMAELRSNLQEKPYEPLKVTYEARSRRGLSVNVVINDNISLENALIQKTVNLNVRKSGSKQWFPVLSCLVSIGDTVVQMYANRTALLLSCKVLSCKVPSCKVLSCKVLSCK
eukprot:gene14423-4243_t